MIETIFPAGGANDAKAFKTSVAEAKQILEKAGYASKFPIEIDKYQTPMINPPMRAGESFVIALMPTGLSESSPNVCRR